MNGINVLSVCGGLDRTYQIIQVGLALLCWGGGGGVMGSSPISGGTSLDLTCLFWNCRLSSLVGAIYL